eukprot:580512-Rhodomonas_salina.1
MQRQYQDRAYSDAFPGYAMSGIDVGYAATRSSRSYHDRPVRRGGSGTRFTSGQQARRVVTDIRQVPSGLSSLSVATRGCARDT